MKSELCILYLDDVTIGGSCQEILQDLAVVREAADLGLTLNNAKSEIITCDNTSRSTILTSLPGAQVVDPACATLLGSPIGGAGSVSSAILEKVAALKRVRS